MEYTFENILYAIFGVISLIIFSYLWGKMWFRIFKKAGHENSKQMAVGMVLLLPIAPLILLYYLYKKQEGKHEKIGEFIRSEDNRKKKADQIKTTLKETEIFCYFCENIAQKQVNLSGGVINIVCPNCKKYSLESKVIEAFLERPDGKILLTVSDRKKISDYIQNKYDDKLGDSILINTDIVRRLTGKRVVC